MIRAEKTGIRRLMKMKRGENNNTKEERDEEKKRRKMEERGIEEGRREKGLRSSGRAKKGQERGKGTKCGFSLDFGSVHSRTLQYSISLGSNSGLICAGELIG